MSGQKQKQQFQTSIGSPSVSTLHEGQAHTPLLVNPMDPYAVAAGADGGQGEAGDWKSQLNWKTAFWCFGAIMGSVVQNVYLQQVGVALPQYPYFIFWSTVIPFNIVFFGVLWAVMYFKPNDITPEMRSIPTWKFILLGGLNALNGIFLLFANPHVPGTIQALLGPTVITIPLAMIALRVMLGHRYRWPHFVALSIIVAGIFVAIYPSVFEPDEGEGFGTAFWNSIWVIGSIPLVIASVFEERVFGEQPVHVMYLLAHLTLWQMMWIFATFWVDAIPGYGTADSVADIFTNQGHALKCLAGHSIAAACPLCNCSDAWWNYTLFIIGYIATNFFTIGVIKYCGALFSYIVGTIVTPLTAFAFAWKALLGSNAQPLNIYDYISLAILLVGMVAYRFAGEAIKPPSAHDHKRDATVNGSASMTGPLLGDMMGVASPPTHMQPVAGERTFGEGY